MKIALQKRWIAAFLFMLLLLIAMFGIGYSYSGVEGRSAAGGLMIALLLLGIFFSCGSMFYFLRFKKEISGKAAGLKEAAARLKTVAEDITISAGKSGEASRLAADTSRRLASSVHEHCIDARNNLKAAGVLNGIIHQVSGVFEEYLSDFKTVVFGMKDLNHILSQVARNAEVASQGARQASELVKVVSSKNKQNLAGIEKIKASTNDAAERIKVLGGRSREISNIVKIIDEIAVQTNLLALNSAIEASRSGNQPKSGYAEVSDEVRKLADRTASATAEIAGLITSMQEDIQATAQVIAGGTKIVAEEYELAEQACEALESIRRVMTGICIQIDQISSQTRQAEAAGEMMSTIIDRAGGISEANSVSVKEIKEKSIVLCRLVESSSAKTQENDRVAAETSDITHRLNAQIEELVVFSRPLKEVSAVLEKEYQA